MIGEESDLPVGGIDEREAVRARIKIDIRVADLDALAALDGGDGVGFVVAVERDLQHVEAHMNSAAHPSV